MKRRFNKIAVLAVGMFLVTGNVFGQTQWVRSSTTWGSQVASDKVMIGNTGAAPTNYLFSIYNPSNTLSGSGSGMCLYSGSAKMFEVGYLGNGYNGCILSNTAGTTGVKLLAQSGGSLGLMDISGYTYLNFTSSSSNFYNNSMFVNSTGVGIGTATFNDLLTLDAGTTRKGLTLRGDCVTNAITDISLGLKTPPANGKILNWDISLRADGWASGSLGSGSLVFYGNIQGGTGNGAYYTPLCFKNNGDVILASSLNATGGNVGIGTTHPQSLLAVAGTITAQAITVTLSGWSDFVFKDKYNLKPLSEVENYIKTNNHLEGIPSEKEVKAQGMHVGEMQAKLLQKVEELTLYAIEQNKKIEALAKANEVLMKKLDGMK